MANDISREEFGRAVARLLSDLQKAEIARLHGLVQWGYHDGCVAASEGGECCVDAFLADPDVPSTSAG